MGGDMKKDDSTYEMKGGRVLTDVDLEALAEEAERGYDPALIARSPGRPRMGTGPAVAMPVRLLPELHTAIQRRAAVELTSVSELVRQAVNAYLQTEVVAPDFNSADFEALAAEAETGYPLNAARAKPRVRRKTEIVPIRVPPEMKKALESRAEAEATSVSEVVRAAIRAMLDGPDPDPPATAAPGGPQIRRQPTEADTCRDYVVPRLKDAGWSDDQIV